MRWDSHIEPQQDYQAPQAGPLLRSDNTSEPAPWISLGEQERQPVQEVPIKAAGASSDEPEAEFDAWDTLDENAIARHEIPAEPWYMQPDGAEDSDADASHEQTNLEEQSWYHMLEETDVAPWSHANNIEPGSPAAVWDTEEQEGELPAPPAWLDKLTKGEFQPPPMPAEAATTPPVEQEPLTFMVKASPQEEAEAVLDTQVPADDSAAASQSSQEQEDEEPFFFGPEWLKSLGAAAIDSVLPQESETPLDVPVEPAQSSGAPEEAAAPSVQSETEQKISVASWLDQAAQKLGQTEQNVLTTLEELENDLRTQGFMQLEPGSFSTLAHEQALSSALAQLGNFGPQPIDEGQPSQTTQAETIPALPTGEPLWPATSPALSQPESPAQSVGSSSQEPTSATPETPAPSSHLEALAKYVSTSAPEPMTETMPEAARTDALASLVANAVPGPAFNASPASETHPSLDSELETTMKRPAVQLQPVQYRLPSQPGQAMTKGRPGERPSMGKAAEGSLSYKERLLKGYQYQLAGAYDEAMQEYRVIIRNAPEFLGDVVSNVRALLKLAPKYSAGYRILGDAYMRQGEYLQAMEAYNKALTMAKKAKA